MARIINRKATKQLILQKAKRLRPGWDCEQVSEQALDQIEAFMINKIQESIKRHPTIGKRFMNFQ